MPIFALSKRVQLSAALGMAKILGYALICTTVAVENNSISTVFLLLIEFGDFTKLEETTDGVPALCLRGLISSQVSGYAKYLSKARIESTLFFV